MAHHIIAIWRKKWWAMPTLRFSIAFPQQKLIMGERNHPAYCQPCSLVVKMHLKDTLAAMLAENRCRVAIGPFGRI
jgi:hypothetical protein